MNVFVDKRRTLGHALDRVCDVAAIPLVSEASAPQLRLFLWNEEANAHEPEALNLSCAIQNMSDTLLDGSVLVLAYDSN